MSVSKASARTEHSGPTPAARSASASSSPSPLSRSRSARRYSRGIILSSCRTVVAAATVGATDDADADAGDNNDAYDDDDAMVVDAIAIGCCIIGDACYTIE